MMTIHSAKGLEFPHVFLCGMNEGIFPSRKTSTLEQMEEERRLAFVAVTRAKDRLYLSEAAGRGTDGSPRYPSRFLLEVGDGLMEYDDRPSEGLVEQARAWIATLDAALRAREEGPRFDVGQRVRHRVFGDGTVEALDGDRSAYTIRFDELTTARSISYRVSLDAI